MSSLVDSLTTNTSKLSSDKSDPGMAETTSDGKTYTIVREGLAEILNPKQQRTNNGADSAHGRHKVQDVFYNPIQQFNRDLSVLAIRAFGEDLAVIREAKQKKRPDKRARGDFQGQKRKRAVEDNGVSSSRKRELEDGAISQERKKESDDHEISQEDRFLNNNNGTSAEKLSGNGIAAASRSEKEEVDCPPIDAKPIGLLNHQNVSKPGPGETAASSKSPFRILDALSATGLRAIRYAKEIPTTTMVIANDLSAQATASINLNVVHNEILDKVNVLTGDARAHMYQVAAPKGGDQYLYEVIDLDPYGTAAPFLDAAVRALVDGGLLCVTCTDAGVFASAGYLEKTFSQYGGLPLKGAQSHEGGLRLVLHSIAVCAARYGLSIEPLLSLSIDFYVRVFVRIYRSPAQVKFLAGKTMAVYNCDEGCGAWNTQFFAQTKALTAKNGNTFHKFTFAQGPSAGPFCEHCGFKTHLSGPMWGGPLHNPYFIRRILDALPSLDTETYGTIPRIEGMLSVAYQEALFGAPSENQSDSDEITRPVPQTDPTRRDHHPFFFNVCTLAGILHCVGPSDAVFCGALKRLGYRTSRSHTKAGSIRTDAPWSVVWEVMREWVRQKAPIKENAIRKGTAGWGILRKDRSKKALNAAKVSLKQVLEKSEDVNSMRTELEAILYRLREEGEGKPTNPLVSSAPAVATVPSDQPPPTPEPQTAASTNRSSSSSLLLSAVTNPSIPIPTPTHELDVIFNMNPRARTPSPARKIVRYQMNPRPDWGPISRARGR